MRLVNKLIRKGDKDGFLALSDTSEALWEIFNKPERAYSKGYQQYELTNNNANINRIKKRIAELETASSRITAEKTVKGVRLVENVEANRVQLIFPEKPAEEVRKKLRKCGFVYSFSEGAYQRFLNNAGIYAAQRFLEYYEPEL